MEEGKPILYDDSMMEEISEMVENMKPLEDSWKHSSWSRQKLVYYQSLIVESLQNPTQHSFWELSVKLGLLGRKLDLSNSQSTTSTIIHTYELLQLCVSIVDDKGIVRVVEGCDENGVMITGDLDLLYFNGKSHMQCDYTHDPGLEVGFFKVWPEKEKKRKYEVLEDTLLEGCSPLVVSFGCDLSVLGSMNIDFEVFEGAPREADFKFADNICDIARTLTRKEAKELLNKYTRDMMKHKVDKSGMVETAGVYVEKKLALDVVNSSMWNNAASMEKYEKWMESLSTLAMVKSDSRIKDYYSVDLYEKIAKSFVKESIEFPEAKRGCSLMSPFGRLGEIMRQNLLIGVRTSCLTYMLHQLEFVETFPNAPFDYSLFDDGEFWHGTTVKRLKRGEEFLNSVGIKFPKGKSWKMFREYQKVKQWQSVRQEGNGEHLEKVVDQGWEELSKLSTGSYLCDDIEDMISEVMIDSPISDLTRKVMYKTFSPMKSTGILSTLAMKQEITMAVLNVPRKRKGVKINLGSFKEDFVVVSLDNVADRFAVAMTNMGPMTFGDMGTSNVMVHGVFPPKRILIRNTHLGLSYTFSQSPAQLDWNSTILHRAVSWMGLSFESVIAMDPSQMNKICENSKMPLLMMFSNNNKFSQVAEMVRYLFVNGVGMSSCPRTLYEKIDWYTPDKLHEKLYIMRMLKMSDSLNIAKSLDLLGNLRQTYHSVVHEDHSLTMTNQFKEWVIAMPDEESYSKNEQHVFNSFYVCRAMTMQRYNKTVSESLVLDKQWSARQLYLEIKSQNLQHEGRFMSHIKDKKDLIKVVMSTDFSLIKARDFSPDPLTIMLGSISSILAMDQDLRRKTIGEICDNNFNFEEVMRKMSVSNVMNNRGSVRNGGVHGVVVWNKKILPDKKVKTVTQNSKCYLTVLQALVDMSNGRRPPKVCENWDLETPVLDYEDDPNLTLDDIAKLSDRLWPLLQYFALNSAQCVSKMVHKDQIGAREIAVLNAAARIMCFYVENLSRHVRDIEHRKGLFVNLIERKDKRTCVEKTLKMSLADRKRGKTVVFDSADCSKWGPSMQCHALYQVLRIRFPVSKHRVVLRNCLTLFGSKVFKIPDNFFSITDDIKVGNSLVSIMAGKLRGMTEPMGSFKHQLFLLEESMHQGILGATSSVLGSDAQNLSNFVTDNGYKAINMVTRSHITSDDYSRSISWNSSAEHSYFKITKEVLAIHYHVLLGFGIKRNLQKSTVTPRYWEFNSEFFTSTGEMRPDVKSRLSYIDYGQSTDPYPNALRCLTQTTEFLRSEGSFIGACWVGLLNNALCMYQNQSRSLWKKISSAIYTIPLELGGLIKVDPLLGVGPATFVPYLRNYEAYPDAPMSRTLKTILESRSYKPDLIETSENEDKGVKVPSLSRSGMVHLCMRPPRSERTIREFLNSLSEQDFASAYSGRHTNSMLLALISCCHRESSRMSSEGSAFRYLVTQTVHDRPLYLCNSFLFKELVFEGKEKVSRKDIHQAALNFLVSRVSFDFDVDLGFPLSDVESMYRLYKNVHAKITPISITPVPRLSHYHPERAELAPKDFVDNKLTEFDLMFKPLLMGGSTKIHPWVYMEARTAYTHQLKKLVNRKQLFRFALRESDVAQKDIYQLILSSNFVAGCRLSYFFADHETYTTSIDSVIRSSLTAIRDNSPDRSRKMILDITSHTFPAYYRNNLVGGVDLTNLMNVLIDDSHLMFLNPQIRSDTVQSLYELSQNKAIRFVIDPLRLSVNFKDISFSSSRCVKIYQRPIKGVSQNVGRELIRMIGTKWEHFWITTRQAESSPVSDHVDQYIIREYQDQDWINVKVDDHFGYTALLTHSGNTVLQILSQSLVKKTVIRLFTSQPIEYDDDLIETLQLSADSVFLDSRLQEVFELQSGYIVENMWDSDQEESEQLQPTMSIEKENELASAFMTLEDDGGDEFLIDEMPWSDDEDEELPDMVAYTTPALPPEPDIEEGEESKDKVYEELTMNKPLSESGIVRPDSNYLLSLSSGSLKKLQYKTVTLENKKHGASWKHGYQLTVPVQLGKKVFRDSVGKAAIVDLLSTFSEMDESDMIWCRSYVMESILHYPPMTARLAEIKSMQTEIEDDDFSED